MSERLHEDAIDELQGSGLDRQCLEWQGQARTITGVVVDLYFCVRQGTCHIEVLEGGDTRTPVYIPTGDTKLSELPQLGDPVEVGVVQTGDGLVVSEIEVWE